MKIILDNGHGENTPGKRSPRWQTGNQLFEWEFNREIVEQTYDLLKEDGYSPEILVYENKEVSIKERVRRANEIHALTPGILVSVHGNAAPNMNNQPNGIETFHFSNAGKKLAEDLQTELVNLLGWKDRGVRKAYQKIKINRGTADEKEITIYKIAILKYTDMKAVLTENGFYTNFDQCMEMLKPEIRSAIAIAHFNAIKEYLFNLNTQS